MKRFFIIGGGSYVANLLFQYVIIRMMASRKMNITLSEVAA